MSAARGSEGQTSSVLSWEGRAACRTPKCSSNSVGMENAPLTLGAHLRRRQDRPAQGPFLTAAQHPPQKEIFSREGGASKAPGTFPAVAPATCHHPHPYSGARPAGRGTPGRPPKPSREGAALSNAVPTCSGRPLAPAPRAAPQATERAARSRHLGGHRPRHRAPNSGRTLISPRGTSRWGGGGVRAADASAGRCRGGQGPALPPGADGARRPLARAGPGRCGAHPWGAGRPRDPGWMSRRRTGPGASHPQRRHREPSAPSPAPAAHPAHRPRPGRGRCAGAAPRKEGEG